MSGSKRLGFLMTSLMVGLLAMPVLGQDQNNGGQNNGGQNNGGQNNGGQNGGGGGGFRGRGNPQAMMDFYKQQLGASDDEFAAIQPKIQAVMQLQRDANAGRGRGMFGGGRGGPRGGGGPGGPGGGGGFGGPPSTQPSPVQDALADLRTTLDDQSASPDTIKAKLEALRQARTKSKQDLAVAQQDLKSVLTQRQEAVMVLFGLLD